MDDLMSFIDDATTQRSQSVRHTQPSTEAQDCLRPDLHATIRLAEFENYNAEIDDGDSWGKESGKAASSISQSTQRSSAISSIPVSSIDVVVEPKLSQYYLNAEYNVPENADTAQRAYVIRGKHGEKILVEDTTLLRHVELAKLSENEPNTQRTETRQAAPKAKKQQGNTTLRTVLKLAEPVELCEGKDRPVDEVLEQSKPVSAPPSSEFSLGKHALPIQSINKAKSKSTSASPAFFLVQHTRGAPTSRELSQTELSAIPNKDDQRVPSAKGTAEVMSAPNITATRHSKSITSKPKGKAEGLKDICQQDEPVILPPEKGPSDTSSSTFSLNKHAFHNESAAQFKDDSPLGHAIHEEDPAKSSRTCSSRKKQNTSHHSTISQAHRSLIWFAGGPLLVGSSSTPRSNMKRRKSSTNRTASPNRLRTVSNLPHANKISLHSSKKRTSSKRLRDDEQFSHEDWYQSHRDWVRTANGAVVRRRDLARFEAAQQQFGSRLQRLGQASIPAHAVSSVPYVQYGPEPSYNLWLPVPDEPEFEYGADMSRRMEHSLPMLEPNSEFGQPHSDKVLGPKKIMRSKHLPTTNAADVSRRSPLLVSPPGLMVTKGVRDNVEEDSSPNATYGLSNEPHYMIPVVEQDWAYLTTNSNLDRQHSLGYSSRCKGNMSTDHHSRASDEESKHTVYPWESASQADSPHTSSKRVQATENIITCASTADESKRKQGSSEDKCSSHTAGYRAPTVESHNSREPVALLHRNPSTVLLRMKDDDPLSYYSKSRSSRTTHTSDKQVWIEKTIDRAPPGTITTRLPVQHHPKGYDKDSLATTPRSVVSRAQLNYNRNQRLASHAEDPQNIIEVYEEAPSRNPREGRQRQQSFRRRREAHHRAASQRSDAKQSLGGDFGDRNTDLLYYGLPQDSAPAPTQSPRLDIERIPVDQRTEAPGIKVQGWDDGFIDNDRYLSDKPSNGRDMSWTGRSRGWGGGDGRKWDHSEEASKMDIDSGPRGKDDMTNRKRDGRSGM
ncbi:hypothetical protein FH972_024419 [Carpinus fangiana]|uniref:Uncharacterized protein n=1 Tax=Carpinus fangiana TaxID=176857 RepID=A0A5N6KYG8_9ROSI|nr:hypothetical protein FH972_024419 [Carpinus fangiana]